MALNLLDPAEVTTAYEAVLSNTLNWFLLDYPNNTVDTLALYAFGSDGLEELKTKIDPEDDEKVVIGFLRADDVDERGVEEEEEDAGGGGETKYVLVSYIPKGVLGVRRARAQVHTRRLGMIFKKHDAVLTADDLSQLTDAAIAQTLVEPDPSILTFHTSTGVKNPGASPTLLTPPPLTTGSSALYTPLSPSASQQRQPAAVDMGRSLSQPPSSAFIDLKPVKRSYSEMYMPPPAFGYNPGMAPSTSPPSHHKLGSNMFSNLLRRKKRAASASMVRDIDESQESEDSMPPPTPPKDKGVYAAGMSMAERRGHGERKEDGIMDGPHHRHHNHHHHRHDPTETGGIYTYEPPFSVSAGEDRMTDRENFIFPSSNASTAFHHHHQHSVSEFAVISHEEVGGGGMRGDAGDVVVLSPDEFGYGYDKPLPSTQQGSTVTLARKGKWAEPRGLSAIKDPAERARVRIEMQREREEEEREALRAEEERQERRRREREEFCRREEEEAEKRKAAIQNEAMRVAAERRRREEEERREEERARREREARKRMERQKRQEEHRRLEAWRREQQRAAEDSAKMEEAARKREEEERKKKILKAEVEVKQRAAKEGAMTGWATVQTDESVVWKRRYYKVVQDTMYLFRTDKETSKIMDTLHVRGSLRGLKEPKDGYEDLKAIPFSFALEFHDRGPWAMFTDTEEEKFKLLGLLHHAAQLDL